MKSTVNIVRIWWVLGAIVVVALLLSVKLYMVQIVQGDTFSERADRQYLRPSARLFDRGSISFQTKEGDRIDAATLQTGYTLAVNPSTITEPADIYNALSFVLKDIDETTFFQRVSKSDDPYEEIAKRLTKDEATSVESLDLSGVSLFKDRWRFYPGKELAAHAIGFLSWKDDVQLGRYGLERQYEDVLNRTDENVFANFFVEIFSGIEKTISGKEQQGSIITTIEPTVQAFLEHELNLIHKDWGADTIGGIIMDPNTGEIRAMAVYPTFDLNAFNKVESVSIFNNPLVEGVYEMGSIVKPITMAIGIDTGVVNADTVYDDTGSLTANNRTIFNHDRKAYGKITLQEMLNKSLNVGAVFVVDKVGNERFASYLKTLLNQKTNIDLPNEASPMLKNLDSKQDIEYMTASYGQGIAVTPIAITRALATLGNGGYLVQPHLVSRIEYDNGFFKEIQPEKGPQVFSQKTSEDISRMLAKAVDDALLDGTVALPHHTVAAKTGTAQIAKEGGGYEESKYLHSFFGYVPAFDPEFIIFLYHVNPKGAPYASQTLTTHFMDITKFLINYYQIPPDR